MNRIIDFPKFKEQCAKYDKPALRVLLWDWSFQRILTELVLVNAINSCKENGELIAKTQTLEDYKNTVEGERILINLLGRSEAAKVYGQMEGVTSDVKTVDFILNEDFSHYEKLVASFNQRPKGAKE